ncbi:photosystem reaction center subunit H [Bradyrhizobium sp. SSBR45G]|uniref:PRC-barrel domain-containing protein n=1 Tax=unclassified Bradyrhizobium TaxID=2631580 RepID=UPI002342A7E2|nr:MULTISPECIES: PRC-barrel domain-containing protein [unclassified Bradyrhizobium]GLH78178.1 photosystem reaction center subunit H [Bradyrhizobium sp. SSBR45G]GLH86055.1 photosystem reaction center subunit H [Bradyrhizobium sp. SSBR45R]
MMMKTVAAGLAGSLLLATAAFAAESTTTTTSTTTRADTTAASYQGDWRSSKLVGVKVYNNNNENVGSIDDLLVDKSGAVKGVVVGVGGFLGMGEHLVAVSFDQIKFSDQPVQSTTAANAPASGTTSSTMPPASTTTTGAATGTSSSSSMSSSKSRWYPDHAMINATKDQLKSMPEFKYAE